MTEDLHGARRLSAEARHQPRQVARSLRTAAARRHAGVAPAVRGMDRVRQGRLRAPLRGLPWREGRRQRPGRDVPAQGPAARIHCGRLQVPHHAYGLAPDRRRSAAHHHARRARHRDAVPGTSCPRRTAWLGDPVRQVRAGGGPQRSEEAIPLLRRGADHAARSTSTPPAPSAADRLEGKDVWQKAKCWECHGQTGKGDGEKAAGLKDDFGFPDSARQSHRRAVQIGPGGPGHLSHDQHGV